MGCLVNSLFEETRVNYSETVGIKGISLSTIPEYPLRRVYGLVELLAVKLIAMSYQYRISLPLSFLKMEKKTINICYSLLTLD